MKKLKVLIVGGLLTTMSTGAMAACRGVRVVADDARQLQYSSQLLLKEARLQGRRRIVRRTRRLMADTSNLERVARLSGARHGRCQDVRRSFRMVRQSKRDLFRTLNNVGRDIYLRGHKRSVREDFRMLRTSVNSIQTRVVVRPRPVPPRHPRRGSGRVGRHPRRGSGRVGRQPDRRNGRRTAPRTGRSNPRRSTRVVVR